VEVHKLRDPATGEYILKSGEHRKIKTVRVTGTAWEKFLQVATSLGISRADLIEQIAFGNISVNSAAPTSNDAED